jgi:hypothetical protein
MPDFDPRLLQFAEHQDRDVRWVATFVLAHHRHPDVRNLALDRVKAGRHNERELTLFRNNYELGDWQLIWESLCWPDLESELHWVLSDLSDVFEANPCEESHEPQLVVYEHSPCTNCRRRAVKALLDTGRAPGWLVDECRFDANREIRKVVADVR